MNKRFSASQICYVNIYFLVAESLRVWVFLGNNSMEANYAMSNERLIFFIIAIKS